MTHWWTANSIDAMAPLARALTDHFQSGTTQVVEFQRSDGEVYQQATDDYFDTPHDLIELENIALDTVRAAAIDIGAACGRLSLALQARDVPVSALDVCPIMTDLLRQRGVNDVITADVLQIFAAPSQHAARWSTAYFLMETIGLVGSPERLAQLLGQLHEALADDAQIILDSAPLLETGDFASVQLQMRYADLTGPQFDWLYLDSQTLASIAAEQGWQTELGYLDDDTGHFLARLTRS